MLEHEEVALGHVASIIAQLKKYDLAYGDRDAMHARGNVFFVPDDTLICDEAIQLGIRSENDIFGAVVPYPFVMTKAITHGLVDRDAERPHGWSTAFPERVRDAVLPGFTAFNRSDGVLAARKLLTLGPLRLKPPLSCGGGGQILATQERQVEEFLDQCPREELAAYGLVLETNLHQVETLSVGRISIDEMVMTYFGVQRTTANNKGDAVYGGSDLTCARGDWNTLERLPMANKFRTAIAKARCYDAAAAEFPGFLATRRNYDVGHGLGTAREQETAVFEASWRVGGASSAELAALTALAEDPSLHVVAASSIKKFGRHQKAARGATIYYQDDDPRDGPLIRYTTLRRMPDTRYTPADRFSIPVG
jgi:hypothetical protein